MLTLSVGLITKNLMQRTGVGRLMKQIPHSSVPFVDVRLDCKIVKKIN